jgi:hypothetical protein
VKEKEKKVRQPNFQGFKGYWRYVSKQGMESMTGFIKQ